MDRRDLTRTIGGQAMGVKQCSVHEQGSDLSGIGVGSRLDYGQWSYALLFTWLYKLHIWLYTCYTYGYTHVCTYGYTHVIHMYIHILYIWLYTCYTYVYTHIVHMAIHMIHRGRP